MSTVSTAARRLVSYAVERAIGSHRGAPRLWLEGREPARAGFTPGTNYEAVATSQGLTLRLTAGGSRVVSKKEKQGELVPVIDLNSSELLGRFAQMSAVRVVMCAGEIHVLPLTSVVAYEDRLQRLKAAAATGDCPMASLSHGGGIIALAVEEGLREAGLRPRLAYANDIRRDLLEHAARVNPAWGRDTAMLAAPIQELACDPWALAHLEPTLGVDACFPCSGASKAGMAKRKLKHPEAHPEVGHLGAAALPILARLNPVFFIFENVPDYAHTASASILRTFLQERGYELHERLLSGSEFNALEDRTRWCMVAMTRGIPFDFAALKLPARQRLRLGDVLEPIPAEDPRWSVMAYLKAKQETDRAAGKNFKMKVVDADSDHVGCINKLYWKVQSTGTKLRHPQNPELLRQLTPLEHARVKGIPEQLLAGLSKTMAHELCGQSGNFAPFKAVARLVGQSLAAFWAGLAPGSLERETLATTGGFTPTVQAACG